MKVVQITPRAKARLFSVLVRREAEIRKKGRGTFSRTGAARAGAALWKHKRFQGSVNLKRDAAEVVTAKVRSRTPENERQLLSAFLGFVDRQCGDQVQTILIDYR